MRKVWVNYNMVRVKLKIGFSMLVRGQTLHELWLRQIMSSFRFLRDSGQIKGVTVNVSEEKHLLDQVILNENTNCLKSIIQYNTSVNKRKNELQKLLENKFKI